MEVIPLEMSNGRSRNTVKSGSLPGDWVEQTIGQFCTVKTGPFGTLLKASEYSELEGVPVISVGEIREGYFRLTEHTPLVPEAVQRRLPQYLLQAGDVVFGRKGAVERSALVRQPQAGWFLGSDGIAVRPTGEHCPEYVAAQFQSARVRQWLALNSTGTTMASMNQGVLSRASIPFPPTLAEERSIADALTDADALIDSLEQLLTKKRQIKQGAMQELLTGQRRLPGHTQDWSKRPLRDVCQMKSGESITSEQLSEGYFYPCYGGNGLRGYAESYTHDGQFALVGRQGALCGNVALVAGRFFASEHAVVVTPCAAVDIVWLHYVLHRMKLNQYSESSAQPGLAVERLLQLDVLVPESTEQTAIAKVLSDMDADITALESRLTKARALKQAMAQALLTGRIRLVKPTA